MFKKYFFVFVLMFAANVLSAQNVPSYLPLNGLVLWMPFNNSCKDESENKLKIEQTDIEYVLDRNNIIKSAISMNGISSKINFMEPIIFYAEKRRQYSISFWISTNFESDNTILTGAVRDRNYDKDSSKNFEAMNYLFLTPKNRPYEDSTSLCVSMNEQTKSNFISSKEKWQNITIVKNENTLSYYIDGKINYSTTIDTSQMNNSSYNYYGISQSISHDDFFINLIGASELYNPTIKSTQYVSFYKGYLDDIAIYNRVLSEKEIQYLYVGCIHEPAISSLEKSVILTSQPPFNFTINPDGGTFSSTAIQSGMFHPSLAKIGINKVLYNYKNSLGCPDSSIIKLVIADTNGISCKFIDTIKIIKTQINYDTVIVPKTVTKYDTVTITNNVTKYDTVKVTKYDTITFTNNVTKYDTILVNKYDTVTITNNVTKYDTVIVNKYDTIMVTNNVTKYDTITLTDTVSILKITFKLTTGIQANQMASMSLYPNPTTDILHIEVGDAKALDGYRYRILDALGKEVYNELVKNAITEIPLKTLGAAGMYQFEVLDEQKTSIQTNKIVLQ